MTLSRRSLLKGTALAAVSGLAPLPGLGRLLFQFLCFAFSFSLFISGFALYAKGRYIWNGQPYGPREVGYILAYAGFLGIILQGALMGPLVKWLGERKLVWTGFLASTA